MIASNARSGPIPLRCGWAKSQGRSRSKGVLVDCVWTSEGGGGLRGVGLLGIGSEGAFLSSLSRDIFKRVRTLVAGRVASGASCDFHDTTMLSILCRLRVAAMTLPLWVLLGGAQDRVPLYTTEGGWLHLSPEALVDQTLAAQADGFKGAKIKIGRPHVSEDVNRLEAVREAVGPSFDLMTDANQGFYRPEAIRRARAFDGLDLAWIEEPYPAEDVQGHALLRAQTTIPVAVGESMYHLSQFREYLERGACSIVQPDVARIGGITPWLKTAHLAEAFNMPVCPHFLMEIHVSLCAAVPNASWVEYIPQLDRITTSRLEIDDGYAIPPQTPGLGIEWDWGAIGRLKLCDLTVN